MFPADFSWSGSLATFTGSSGFGHASWGALLNCLGRPHLGCIHDWIELSMANLGFIRRMNRRGANRKRFGQFSLVPTSQIVGFLAGR